MTSQSLSLQTDVVQMRRDNTESLLPSHAWQSKQVAACWKCVEAMRAIRNSASVVASSRAERHGPCYL